ncbi:ABC transporter substrate-binding protein [Erysipelothrix anatis]|uniref:ABC transporter substrate-binding protein n=1 Tax=Erysipelothrix anatis TaxID=2683713 RepID=UPI00135717DC|nr:ABC transporter substrate-binding protein [Erysipelothrix anatis]
MKKIITLLLCLFVLTGCLNTPKPDLETPLKVGTLAAESALPIIIAHEEGFFKSEGINVEIVPFANPQERNAAAQSGAIDMMIADAMTAFAFQEQGFPYIITSDINEDFKIIASPNSGITTMKDLQDQRVALIPGLLLEYVMDEIAAKDAFDYQVLAMASFPGRFEGLLQDQFEAVVFTEPQAGMLVAQGAHLLGSSSEYGIKGGSLLTKKDRIEKDPEIIARFYRAYNQGVEYLNKNQSDAYAAVLTQYAFPPQMGAYIDQKTTPFEKAKPVSNDQLESIATWSLNKGLVEQLPTIKNTVNFSFIEE